LFKIADELEIDPKIMKYREYID